MKYLKKFENHAAYEAIESSLVLPNVSLCVQEDEVHYNPYVEPIETRVVAKHNVTSTSSPTRIASGTTSFTAIEIDGVVQPSVTTGYTFTTTGEHTVKYTLTSPTIIGNNAFDNCSGLTSINIPDSVTTIDNYAFNGCWNLTSCTIDSGVTSIGNYAFQSCYALRSIDIPSGVTSIGDWAFYYCTGFTSIDIPSGVTSIGYGTFRSCRGLTSINIPDSVTTIGTQAFRDCSGLTSCTIGSGVTSIGESAFANCENLTRLNSNVDGVFNIPSGVTSIGYGAFLFCSGMTSIDIPSSVTSIGDMTFADCRNLTSVTVNSTTPPTLSGNPFYGLSLSQYTIYVPSGSVNTYKSASGWSNYASRIQAIS